MLLDRQLYLGRWAGPSRQHPCRADQASDPEVIHGLGITHVLSTSRIRASKFRGLVYILVNKVRRAASIVHRSAGLLLRIHPEADH
jgi:hypothetical protein